MENILTQAGPLGAILVWFMFRNEKILKDQTAAINALATAQLLNTIENTKNDTIRSIAQKQLDEINKK